MKQITIILLLLITNNIIAQTNGSGMPNAIPTSPNVASLEKFGDYPISHSNGTVGISANLYTFSIGKGLTLNIQLDYHSSGIKVDDICSWVGTGWALSAGGCISREIRGVKDEAGLGFYKYSISNKGHKYPDPVTTSDYNLLKSIATGTDSEPDMFSYNLNGITGRFFLDNNGEFQTVPYSNIKITKHPLSNLNGYGIWEIIDESGVKYIFNESETTFPGSTERNYITAWWLEKIISPEGNILVSFEYDVEETSYTAKTVKSKKYYESAMGSFPTDLIAGYLSESNFTPQMSFISRNIKKINIPGRGYINFEATDSRKDITGKKLTQVKFYDTGNKFINGYTLKYIEEKNRPFLSMIEKAENNTTITYRRFIYHSGLPVKGSPSQDLWGYYNGAANTNLFPFIYGFAQSVRNGAYIPAVSRYPTDKAVCGTIKEIHYPTGGYTQFEFENNRVSSSENVVNIIQTAGQFSQNNFGEIASSSFDISTAPITGTMSISKHTAGLYETEIILWDVTNNKAYMSWSTTDGNRSPTYTDASKGFARYTFPINLDLILPGTYKWIIKITKEGPGSITPDLASINYTYYKPEISTINEKIVGGLRIAQVTHFDKDKSILSQTKYKYVSNNVSSGIAAPEPKFVKDYAVSICVNGGLIPAEMVIREFFDSNIESYKGEAVSYSFVSEEKNKGVNDVIKTEYTYSVRDFKREKTYLPNVPSFVCVPGPFTNNEYKGGLLLNKTEYKNTNGTYSIIRKETNNYTLDETNVSKFKAMYVYTYFVQTDCKNNTDNIYYATRYDLIPAKVYLNKKTVEETAQTGTTTTTTEYAYTNNIYLQPTSIIQYDSKKRKIETINKYCYDSSGAVADSMKTKNMISQPIQTIKKIDNIQTEQIQYNFDHFNSNKITELKSILQQNGANSELYGFYYHNYDSYGNPLYITKDDVTKIIYLWSYNGQYPIAEIKNATYDQVKTALGVTPESLSSAASPNSTLINGLRTNSNLSQALITTYTYKPLVGILTMTDPCEVTTHYEYDSFGRLKASYVQEKGSSVKKLLQSYDYHYQNQ